MQVPPVQVPIVARLPAHDCPEQVPPVHVPPTHVPPEQTAPTQRWPGGQAAPVHTPPEHVPFRQVPPVHVPPLGTPFMHIPPVQVAPVHVPPEQVAPVHCPPEQGPEGWLGTTTNKGVDPISALPRSTVAPAGCDRISTTRLPGGAVGLLPLTLDMGSNATSLSESGSWEDRGAGGGGGATVAPGGG